MMTFYFVSIIFTSEVITTNLTSIRIADFLRFDRFNTSLIKEEKYVALQRLTRSRYQLIGQLTEMKQHFLENLYYKCNTLTQEVLSQITFQLPC